MIILAQSPTPVEIDEAIGQTLSKGLELTNSAFIYAGIAIVVYAVLLFLGRLLKHRLRVPLGWFYRLFCFAMALFIPSVLPRFHDFDWSDAHIKAAVVITGAFVVISFIRHFIFESSTRREDAAMPKFVSQMVATVIVVGTFLVVLQAIYHVDVPGLWAGAGIAGIVLGLALQDTLGSMFSGIAIYFGGQFKAGDWLLVDGQHAQIVEINWRSTRLRTLDDVYLDIPNSNITKQTIVNYNYPNNLHGLLLDVGLEYDAPPGLVKEVLTKAALDCPHVLRDPHPNVYLENFGDWAITYRLRFWLDRHELHRDALSEIRTNLWYALRRHNISIPYPIQGEYHYEPLTTHHPRVPAVREVLRKVTLYQCLNEEQFEQIVGDSRIVTFGCGENIICQGAPAGSMYVIVQGCAEVFIDSNGTPMSVARIGPGDCIGEVSVLTGEERSATVRAIEDCHVVEVSKAALAPVIAASAELQVSLSDLLAQRRMKNEGIIAGAESSSRTTERQEDYRAGFLRKLKSFFEI